MVDIRALTFLYINDLSAVSDITFPIMFADDTSIFIQGQDLYKIEEELNCETKRLSTWLKINKL